MEDVKNWKITTINIAGLLRREHNVRHDECEEIHSKIIADNCEQC